MSSFRDKYFQAHLELKKAYTKIEELEEQLEKNKIVELKDGKKYAPYREGMTLFEAMGAARNFSSYREPILHHPEHGSFPRTVAGTYKMGIGFTLQELKKLMYSDTWTVLEAVR